ncbi:hypothetical protein H6G97_44055, partial [Nostoc flagelliforme FACHB-838]|nr:hypothetical protein [Nostoc flagelliforme FACHB-838]
MNENCLAYGIEISDSDWEKTPASIKQLVEKMGQHIKQSEKRLAELEVKYQELLENEPIRNSIKSSLQEAADYEIGFKEKTPLAKTVRTCRQILKLEPALWLFVI